MRKSLFSRKQQISVHTMKGLRVSLTSPEQMRSWSSGEVVKDETINYRTLKPEPGGLCCERIFGPTKDWTCSCGKYKRIRNKGKTCERCGVQCIPSRARRTRMGHIELVAPISHIWYARGTPGKIGLLLDLSSRELDAVLSYTHYIILSIDQGARLKELERVKEKLVDLESYQDIQGEDAIIRGLPSDESVLEEEEEDEIEAFSPTEEGISYEEDEPQEEDLLQIEREMEELRRAFLLRSRRDRLTELREMRRLLTEIAPMTLLSVEDYRLLQFECSHVLRAGIGAEAIEELLKGLDLETLAHKLRQEVWHHDGAIRSKVIKRLKVVEALRKSGARPEWMILRIIPVLPPDLRPVLSMGGGRFAAADINELYCRVIHRNNRLKRFLAMEAPDILIHREKQALQAACDALFDNLHTSQPMKGMNQRPLRSLTDLLHGKKGRFRRYLLGKRVDYSGRSVICVGLDLKLSQCGLPKKIALELFKPFIIHKLLAQGIVETPRQAKRAIERREKIDAVWDALADAMQGKVVLLNRAPTLHRLSIQAFEPILVEGNAISLHPQVCSAFNADFDGDQMAVHLPLTQQAQEEARELLLSTRNLLSPASGEPSISISQEQVMGCFYLTQERPGAKGEGRVFASADEAMLAHSLKMIDLHARIVVCVEEKQYYIQPPPARTLPCPDSGKLRTTVGRLIFNTALPKKLRFRNYEMKKESLKQLIWECVKAYGSERAAKMADAIKKLGFTYATKSGLSFSISDVRVPKEKKLLLAQADMHIRELQLEWEDGLITREELSEQVIAIWTETTDKVAKKVQQVLDPYGPISIISTSGATKARLQQIRQLSGMRGLMASPSGKVIETPVRGNFLEGLTVAEYFLSSHGARKSLMDRSLNTAEAGYLTLRFVNVAQEIIVTEEDCGTEESLLISEQDSRQMGLSDNWTRLIGRVLAEPLPHAGLAAGDEIDEEALVRIMAAKIAEVRVRSVLACQSRRGVCRRCYGWDLSKHALVEKGVAVGIIAAQSIGEPGTQLTMRTFHTGGIAGGQSDITQGIPRVEELFEARVPKETALVSEVTGVVRVIKHEGGGYVVQVAGTASVQEEYPLPDGSQLLIKPPCRVQLGQVIAFEPVKATTLLSRYMPKKADVRARLTGDAFFNAQGTLVISGEGTVTHSYEIRPGQKLLVTDGQRIEAGDALTSGALNPQEVLRYRGREGLGRYLLLEAQQVYRTTGAYIHDKHFEVILHQMLRYVRVVDAGDTDLLPEDIVDRLLVLEKNAEVLAQGGSPAQVQTILLGMSQAALATESWLSAASFQQTGRVLTDAVLAGKTDYLVGLKENVMIGKLIPAGTGLLPPKQLPRSRSQKKLRRGR